MAQPKKYSFVTSTDDLGGFKDASVQRLVRQHAMWETSRVRRFHPEWSKNIRFRASTMIADNADPHGNQDPISNDNNGTRPDDDVSAGSVPKVASKRARGRKRVYYTGSSEGRKNSAEEHAAHTRATTTAVVRFPQLALDASSLGSGRLDPFQTYPVELDPFKESVFHDSQSNVHPHCH